MIGDLHCHTRLSDGSLGIEEVIAQAKRTGLDFLSITDHDTLSSASRAAVLGERYGVRCITGVEFSAWDKARGRKAHILCYMPEKPDRLEGLCLKTCEQHKKVGKQIIEAVTQRYPITAECILKYASGSKSIFKQHIMHVLMDYGYTNRIYGDLYHELFDPKTGICYLQTEYPDVNFVIDLIHSAKGIAVLAHPRSYDSFDLLEELASAGKLDGVEVWHPSLREGDEKHLLEVAEKYNLISTGGSDFHGMYNYHTTHLGGCTTPGESLDRIFKKNA